MESIPEPIRGKLVGGGYDSLEKLPNQQNMDRWTRVQTRCGLDDPELDQVMNIRFPVQQGGTGDVIPIPKAVVQSTIEGGHHAMLTLQYGTNPPLTENFLLDTGCMPDLYIPRELADRLGVPDQFYQQGIVKGAGDIRTPTPFFVKPVMITFSSGRDTLRETVSTKTYVAGGQNIVGRDAMRRLRIGIPVCILFKPPTHFSLPILLLSLSSSQTETVRKEVQAFLMLRALHRQLQAINSTTLPCPETETADNLYSSITDKGFLCVDEKNLLPANCTAGSPFDMRGKRFLEVRLIPVQQKTNSIDGVSSTTNGAVGANTPDNGSRTHSPNRNSGSMWGINTKRLFGSSHSSSSAHASTFHINSPASPVPGANAGAAAVVASNDPILLLAASKRKVLFVQDNKNLYLVTCDKPDSRSGFKILIAAPLLYTDAQTDPHDVHKFRLTVRIQREMEYMYTCEPNLTQLYREGGADTLLASQPGAKDSTSATTSATNAAVLTPTHGSNGNLAALSGTKITPKEASIGGYPPHTKYIAPKLESLKFLKPRGKTKTNFFTLTVRVESELACRLAVQHIENKRKEQAEAKIAQFQHILEHWASEHDIDVNEH